MAENINKNFLNPDWWAKATVDDVEAEIAKGADVNARNDDGLTALLYSMQEFDPWYDIVETLIKFGADVNIADSNGCTALMLAAHWANDPDLITLLINNGANINAIDNQGHTALMYASKYNWNSDIFKTLIDYGANINVKDNTGNTALIYAAEYNGEREIARRLIELGADISIPCEGKAYYVINSLHKIVTGINTNFFSGNWWKSATVEDVKAEISKGAEINAEDECFESVLDYAVAYNSNPDVIKMVVSRCTDINYKNEFKRTALMWAAAYNDNPLIIKTLIELGADINAKDERGESAFTYALKSNSNPEVLKILLKYIVDINSRALMIAAENNKSPDIIRTLIELGLNVNEKGQEGHTALMIAAGYNKNPEIMRILIKYGANVNEIDNDGMTALMYAAYNDFIDNFEGVKILLALNVDVNICDNNGNTALMYATKGSPKLNIVKILIEFGADVNSQNNDGITALIWQAQHNAHPEIIKALIEAGADIELKDSKGKTALDYAKEKDDKEIIDILTKLTSTKSKGKMTMIDIKTIVFNALENIVQPEIAKWLDAFFTMKLGKYYWNDYIVHGYAERICIEKNKKRWLSSYKGLQDIDISKLWDIVLYFKNHFNNANDDEYGNLYNIKQAIGALCELRNKTDHNSATNISNLSEDDLYSIVSSLSTINASEESKNKIKNMIREIREDISLPISQKKDKTTDTTFEQTIKNVDRWKRKKKEAQKYCCEHGYQVNMAFCNLASESKARKGEYWLNPNPENLENDWDIILNDAKKQCFRILHIPANTFTMEDFHIRNTGRPDLYIDMRSFMERNSKVDFKPYLVKTIEY